MTTNEFSHQPEAAAVLSREPWPAQGIDHYRHVDDGDWGYLVVYSDGRFYFDSSSVPSRDEILARWACYLGK